MPTNIKTSKKVSFICTVASAFLFSNIAYGNLCGKAFSTADNGQWLSVEDSKDFSLKDKTVRITVNGGTGISDNNKLVQLTPGDVIEGDVIESRLPLGIEIKLVNSNTLLILKDSIANLEAKVQMVPTTIENFREKYSGKISFEFQIPFGPKTGLSAMPSLVGKTIAIFAKDPKNLNTDKTISGKVIDGLPSSPEYSILEADGTIRNLFYTSIQEIRVLSE